MTQPTAMTRSPDLADFDGPIGIPKDRLESVDVLRGAIMVLMVLDHVRDYLMNARVDPTDLAATSPALFFTRWITHFCAPTFVLLAGVGAALAGARGKSRRELSVFLLTRGLWLIVLEQIVASLGMFFVVPQALIALILWAIGWSMIALAGLIYLPRPFIGAIGVLMIAFHNVMDGASVGGAGPPAILWGVLHQPGFYSLPGGVPLLVGYPLIPWIGVMASGYTLGPVLPQPPARRRRILLWLGGTLVAGFVILRLANVYGDPRPWKPQASPAFTLISFLNCQKYPPSLLYLMMTLGPSLIALGLLDRARGPVAQFLRTLGRVPLFYYILQWPVAHGLAILLEAARGRPIAWLYAFPPFESPEGYGHSLATVYLFWILTVALLYLPCRWFADLKRRRRDAWLSYF